MHLKHINKCRVCGSPALTKVVDLGSQHLQGSFIKLGKTLPPMRKIPVQLVRCDPTRDENGCGLLQMAHSVPPSILYAAYWYRSGTNKTMRNHLSEIASEAATLINKKEALVLDIGCNDGTLLKKYPSKFKKFGIDPSDIAQENIDEDIRVIQDIFPSEKLNQEINNKKFDIITSIAMFYDVENPVLFVKNIKECLSMDGVWIFEMSYMPSMLKMNSYDTICHEHLEYYSLSVVENILRRAGMKVFDAKFNDINGGSIRCYATHDTSYKFFESKYLQRMTTIRQHEFELELDTDKPYNSFQERINVHRDELVLLLKRLKSEGKKIHVYGASTKGNTILQWCGIDNSIIDYAADRNPEKDGAKTLGTNIPIVSESKSRDLKPDYYLVLPWHFRKEFIEREKQMLNHGVGMIFPLPVLEIYKK